MSYSRIKEIIEGLTKKDYNSILDGLELGVELEMLFDAEDSPNYRTVVSPDTWLVVEPNSLISSKILSLMDTYNTEYDYLDSLGEVELAPEIEDRLPEFQGFYSGTVEDINEGILELIEDIHDKVKTYEKGYRNLLGSIDTNNQESVRQINTCIKILEELDSNLYSMEDNEYSIEDKLQGIAEEESYTDGVAFTNIENFLKDEYFHTFKEYEAKAAIPSSFNIVEDESLPSNGVELITPVFKYEDFIEIIPALTDMLSQDGFYASDECGYHIGLSSSRIDIHELINNTYDKYKKKGYSNFASMMATTQQDFLSPTAYGDSSRGTENEFTVSLYQYVNDKSPEDITEYNMKDLLWNCSELDYYVEQWSNMKYANVNQKHPNYIELRTLGGVSGFDTLQNAEELKKFLYTAVSQVFGGVKELSTQEISKLINTISRKINRNAYPKKSLAKLRRGLKDYKYKKDILNNPLEAVKQNGNAIEYIKNPSKEVQLEAVRENGYAIQWIENPSEEVQLAAVNQNWNAIRYIENPSEATQLKAVRKNSWAIQYIDNPSEKVQLEAVREDGYSIRYIENPTPKVKALQQELYP